MRSLWVEHYRLNARWKFATAQLKAFITCRQKVLATGNEPFYKILRNKVNRMRKYCWRLYYEAKVKDLGDQKTRHWWQEVKLLCGTGKRSRRDLTAFIQSDLVCEESFLAGKINEALKYCARVPTDGEQQVNVTELSVARKLRDVSTSRAGSPDDLPNWVLTEFADVLRGTQRRLPP